MGSFNIYRHDGPFILESGAVIHGLEIGYHTYGKLNAAGDNVVWVCHALTANSDVFDWWPGLVGHEHVFNPRDHYIICANILGSPYGTTHPLSVDPDTGRPYYLFFPAFTIRDIVSAHELLAAHLEIRQISVLIGGSMGGQQAMEWAIKRPGLIGKLLLLATNARHSPWGIAFNESQRLALAADPSFQAQSPGGGSLGLKAARSIALLSYRTYETYGATQKEDTHDKTDQYKAASYQNYQGEKLTKRFNAYSYWYLSKAMDSHHVGRGRGSAEEALGRIEADTLVISIKGDLLFPPAEQAFIARHVRHAHYTVIDSLYGHDGFLVETALLSTAIGDFLAETGINKEKQLLHKTVK